MTHTDETSSTVPTAPPASSAPDVEALADRLRVAVQGCTLHIHGPVQAWAAIRDVGMELAVLRVIDEKSRTKVDTLRAQGVGPDDPRIRKELVTLAFCDALLGHAGCLG